MSSRPKVCFAGNCQAQVFQSLSGHLGLDVQVLDLPAAYLFTDADYERVNKVFDEADFIFNQRVDENYPIVYLRDASIKKVFPGKSVSWPNIYFDGYFPGIRYFYDRFGQKIEGPLGDYHFETLWQDWLHGKPSTRTTIRVDQPSVGPSAVEASLAQLEMREANLDCTISDYVRSYFRHKKLFHSMNHPCTDLLVEMLSRLMRKASVPFREEDCSNYAYALNQIDIPSFGLFRTEYRPTFVEKDLVRGKSVSLSGGFLPEASCEYDWSSLAEAFFQTYDFAKENNRLNNI